MRTTKVTLAAAGAGVWVPVDFWKAPFALDIGCIISSGASLTYKVQYTHDNPLGPALNCNITRSTTTATVKTTGVNHGLSVTDSFTIVGSGDPNLDGTFTPASIVDAVTFTYTVANTGLTQSAGSVGYIPMRVFDHGTITGKTANADGTLTSPVGACRLNATVYTSGFVTMILNQGRT
jgi:hypothetical protein